MSANDSTPVKTRSISRRLRFEILRRDGHTCRYCGGSAPNVALAVDHVIPVALGGTDEPGNLVTACRDCNSGKTSSSPNEHHVADINAKALEWAKALEAAADARRADIGKLDMEVKAAARAWHSWTDAQNNTVPADQNWLASLERFLSLGLSVQDMSYFIKVTMESRAAIAGKWRYFCGCCWKEIQARQDLAAKMLSAPPPATETPVDESSFDDGYAAGFEDGCGYGKTLTSEEQREQVELAYAEGFRRGANRLAEHRAPDWSED